MSHPSFFKINKSKDMEHWFFHVLNSRSNLDNAFERPTSFKHWSLLLVRPDSRLEDAIVFRRKKKLTRN